MTKIVVCFFLLVTGVDKSKAQTLARIHVNLYTDSLKKGTYNYINIDGELPNGKFLPLDSTRLQFAASAGTFHGNSLWLDPDLQVDKINISVFVKDNKELQKSFVMYVKKTQADEPLRTEQQIIDEIKAGTKKKKA